MASNPLPVNLYESLLSKLVIVLKLTHSEEGITTPAAKQAILQAVSVTRFSLNRIRICGIYTLWLMMVDMEYFSEVIFYKCQKPLLDTNKFSALKVIKTARLTSFVQCLSAVFSEQMQRHKSRKIHVA